MRPTVFAPLFANQRAPSGPRVMPLGRRMPRPEKVRMCPSLVMRPIVFAPLLVNQTAPSGPAVMPIGSAISALWKT
jgi:hypothetical protein